MKRPVESAELLLLAVILSIATADSNAQQTPATGAEETDENVVVLSPFEVIEDEDSGYTATSTLAGTRINTKLRDVGASISVFTPEFLADTGATSAGGLLTLAVSSEVGGVGGNFAGGTSTGGRPDQSDARESPQGNQRVRGIGPAALSRDYFLTDVAFDAYNVSAVTMNRGPNSLLFGIGNPAGVIEASTIKPILTRNGYSASTRYGSNDSYRGTFDINHVLAEERFAFRLAGMFDENNYDQKPAFDREKRLFGTLKAVIAKNEKSKVLGELAVTVAAETGERNSTPVNVTPPTNAFSIWFSPLDPALENLPGVNLDPKVLVGGPGYIWTPKVLIDNRRANSAIPQLTNSWVSAPYFIQIPLIYDTPGQIDPGYQNTTDPALSQLAGIMGRIRYTPAANGRGAIDAQSTKTAYQNLAGFVTPTLQNREIFDYRNNLLSGGSNTIEQGFTTFDVALTQEFLDHDGGIELAYDTQVFHSRRFLPFSSGLLGAQNGVSDINIDVGMYLSNDLPNPNVGRPFIANIGSLERYSRTDRDSFRATAFYRLDLEREDRRLFGIPLGTHTITGLFTTQEIDSRTELYELAWDSTTRDVVTDVFQERLGLFRSNPIMVHYVGPSALNANSVDDVRITDPFAGRLPQHGDTYTTTFFDFPRKRLVTEPVTVVRFLDEGTASLRKIDSRALSVQSSFFDNNLVSVVGWRTDGVKTYSGGSNRLANQWWDPANYTVATTPELDESVSTFTWSVVARYPEKLLGDLPLGLDLGLYYNSSGNFNPVSVRHNLLGELLPAPAGETQEFGLLLEFLNRRASLRLNWYKTTQANTSNDAQGATQFVFDFSEYLVNRYDQAQDEGIVFSTIPGVTAAGYTSYEQLYTALIDILPEPVRSVKNLRLVNGSLVSDPLPGLTDTTNLEAKGFEAELVGNLTEHWRVSFNVAQQETVVNGSARLTKQIADELYANLEAANLLGIDDGPALPQRNDVQSRFDIQVTPGISATIARDGAVSQEQREWRANFVNTYDLTGTGIDWLKNVAVGGAIRWQSKIAIGNPFLTGQRLKEKIVETNPNYDNVGQIADSDPVMQTQFPDLENPFYGPEEFSGDIWISYRRKIFKDIDWRLQLNVQNAWGNSDDIPVVMNPDGALAVIRIPNETRWFLTSTFSF